MRGPLREGEACLLIDERGRRYLVRLDDRGVLHSHLGVLPHSQVIGLEEGSRLATSKGHQMLALRPGLDDYILKMKRGPQVVYPKDLGLILVYADVAPGCVVVEGGTGSGALTMALLRSVGPKGRVVTVERRPDHAERARKSIEGFFGEVPRNLDMRSGAVEQVVEDTECDRIVLDVPEPWSVIAPSMRGLRSGGVFCAYVPTVTQLSQTVAALRASGRYEEIEAMETLLRTWKVEGLSVRPDHRMVGHTGFVTVARKVAATGQNASAE